MTLRTGGPGNTADRLDSWKEIAAYLGREIRTVRRWEASEALPVRRLQHGKSGSVYAFRHELDAWMAAHSAGPRRSPLWQSVLRARVVLLVTGILILLAAVLSFERSRRSGENWTVQPITAEPGQTLEPTLAPDGQSVAYVWNGPQQDNFDIYVRPLSPKGAVRRLTTSARSEFSPAWSPRGDRLAYVRALGSADVDIVIQPLSGGPERIVGRTQMGDWPSGFNPGPSLTWSPNGKWLVIAARPLLQGLQRLVRVSVDTGDQIPLTAPTTPDRGDGTPAFSPDGRSLAFTRHASWGVADLHILALTEACEPAGPPRRIQTDKTWNVSPAWFDARQIVFSHGTLFATRLAMMPVSGRGSAVVLPGEVGDRGWFPSARSNRIIYTERVEIWNLWRHELGRPGDRITRPEKLRLLASTRRDYNPQYSPDGRRIAFNSDRTGEPELWVSDSDGGNAERWTASPGCTVTGAEWSPDGKRILIACDKRGQTRLYTVSGPGAPLRFLHAPRRSAWNLLWSPDGKCVYFASDDTSPPETWKLAAEGESDPVQVTHNQSVEFLGFTDDARFVYYNHPAEGAHHLWRMPAGGGPGEKVSDFIGSVQVRNSGVYLTHYEPGDSYRKPTCLFFRAHHSRVEEPLFCIGTSIRYRFAVSPDERYVLYSRPEFEAANLTVAERTLR